MKATVLTDFGGIENLVVKDIPVPEIADQEVLIQVKAFSINPVDVKTRKGKGIAGLLKDLDPIILGWDVSGVVTASRSAQFKVGDEVFGMVNFRGHGQAYAEYVAAPAGHLALKPSNISHEEAAGATLAALTAWQALVTNAKVKAGDRVLIHSAAGGVGHYAVQIAKGLGAFVAGTASATNKDFVHSIGVDQHIDYQKQRFEEDINDIDFVLDTIGGENIDRSLEVIRPGGTLISIPSGLNEAVTEKSTAKGINGYFIMVHSSGEDMAKLADLLEKGVIKSHISHIFKFEEVGDAHEQVESGKTRGKVVISI